MEENSAPSIFEEQEWNESRPLCSAINLRNIQQIKELIISELHLFTSHAHRIDYKTVQRFYFEEMMPLICESDDIWLCQVFLKKGCNPNHLITIKQGREYCEEYPLNYAFQNNAFYVAKLLIKYGAKTNSESKISFYKGRTPLHLALNIFTVLRYEIIKMLLENGTNPNQNEVVDPFNRPLEIAIEYCDLKMICLLLKYGAKNSKEVYIEGLIKGLEQRGYDSNYSRILLKKRFSTEVYKYYPLKTKKAIVYTYFYMKRLYHKMKKPLLLFILDFMI
jgi:hypothetical protein